MGVYSKIPTAQFLGAFFKSCGILDIVISPGSRNAPLTIQFTEDEDYHCHSIVDERVAGFYAMGIAQKIGNPVVLLCTSGSALLNYYPAVAEAFYSGIPLIVLSADRPQYKIDIGDGQTIRQENVYGNHVHGSYELELDEIYDRSPKEGGKKVEEGDDMGSGFSAALIANINSVKEAIRTSITQSGPVHLNVPFEEPLYEITEDVLKFDLDLPQESKETRNEEMLLQLLSHWAESKRKMILIGVLPPEELNVQLLNQLVEKDNVLIWTETTSNCLGSHHIASIDQVVAPIELLENKSDVFEALRPDVLITMGGMIVSKKVKSFLRSYPPRHHYHIGKESFRDSFYCLKAQLEVHPNEFLQNLIDSTPSKVSTSYQETWIQHYLEGKQHCQEYLSSIPYCDFTVFHDLLVELPDQPINLHFSNSSAIRYAQLFPMKSKWKVFCNRGTSGIDGSLSTCIGSSIYETSPSLMITGDLSFFYDSNALWNDRIRSDFRIIVINNGGGGIFRILPGNKHQPSFKKYFETRHELDASQLAEMFGFSYLSTSGDESIAALLPSFLSDKGKPGILEIFTPTELNDQILLAYFKFLAERQHDFYSQLEFEQTS